MGDRTRDLLDVIDTIPNGGETLHRKPFYTGHVKESDDFVEK